MSNLLTKFDRSFTVEYSCTIYFFWRTKKNDKRKKRSKQKRKRKENGGTSTRLIHTFAHVLQGTFIEKNLNIYSHLINRICSVLLYFYKCTDASPQLCRSDTICACKSNITSMLIICDHSSRRDAYLRFSLYVSRLLDWKKRSATIRRCRCGRHPWRETCEFTAFVSVFWMHLKWHAFWKLFKKIALKVNERLYVWKTRVSRLLIKKFNNVLVFLSFVSRYVTCF